MSSLINFYCEKCNTTIQHAREDVIKSNNNTGGLSLVTDIHRCKDGLLTITNLDVDSENQIRAYKFIALAEIFKKNKFGIPSYTINKQGKGTNFKNIQISHLPGYDNTKLIFKNYSLRLQITIGEISPDEDPITKIYSEMKSILIEIFNFDGELDIFENWLKILGEAIETNPPVKFAYLMEIFLYALENSNRNPMKMDRETLKSILLSHEMQFSSDKEFNFDKLFSRGNQIFDTKTMGKMMKLLSTLKGNPNIPLSYYAKEHNLEMEEVFDMVDLLEDLNYVSFAKDN